MKRDLLRILLVNVVAIVLAIITAHTGPLPLFFVLAVLVGYVLPLYTLIAVVLAFRRRALRRRIAELDEQALSA